MPLHHPEIRSFFTLSLYGALGIFVTLCVMLLWQRYVKKRRRRAEREARKRQRKARS